VQSIDAARAALSAGDASGALAELDRYDHVVETHVLDREAAVLRIEALLRRGDDERARALFDRYAARYPGDPHVTRLRARWGSIAK
jgi:outer membrane protein assembly factor BamD (BamD/ComL family)